MAVVELPTSLAAGPVFIPHQLSSALNDVPALNRAEPLIAVLPTKREKVTEVAEPAENTAPPALAAELAVNALVFTVSGPLSTMIAPPLPPVAWLLEKVELVTL